MATYYVTQAAGGAGVGTEGDPFTLTQALDTVAAGDTVYVKADAAYTTEYATGGAKNSIFYTVTSGTLAAPIKWIGYHTTITDGGVVTIDAQDTLQYALESTGEDYQQIENVVFKQATGLGGYFSGCTHWYFKNCSFEENGDDGLTGLTNAVFIGCRFMNNVGEGVDLNGAQFVFVACLFHGNQKLGASYTSYAVFVFCAFYNNGLAGGQWGNSSGYSLGQVHIGCTFDGENDATMGRAIYCNTVSSGIPTIVNCILHDNTVGIDGSAQTMMATAGNLFNSNGIDINNGDSVSAGDFIGDDGDVSDVPGFNNEGADDYELGVGSAAENKGIDAKFTTDFWASFDGLTNPPVV